MKKKLVKWILLTTVVIFGMGTELKLDAVLADSSVVADLNQLEALLVKQLQIRTEEIVISYTGDKEALSARLPQLMKHAIEQDDYTAYIVDSYFYSLRTWSARAKLNISVRYRETLEETAYVNRQTGEILDELITSSMNDHQKVKMIHDWIVRTLQYDTDYERYTAYSALTDGKAVCQGYTLLAYKLLQKAGIENKIVEGTVNTGDHAWNLVRLDGVWYHLDTTWDDPLPDRGDEVSYSYYLKTDQEIRWDHAWVKSYPRAEHPYVDTITELQQQGGHLAFLNYMKRLLASSDAAS